MTQASKPNDVFHHSSRSEPAANQRNRFWLPAIAMLLAIFATSSPAVAQQLKIQFNGPNVVDRPEPPRVIVPVDELTLQPSLRDYLIANLKATTDEQQAYIDEVVALVNQKRLEESLVLSLEKYSRRKSPIWPLPTFERALCIMGTRTNVTVPKLDDFTARNRVQKSRNIRSSKFFNSGFRR